MELRLAQHRAGTFDGYTAQRKPVELVYTAEMATRREAIENEMKLKGWSRVKKEALIRGDWEAIRVLARGRALRPSTRPSLALGPAQDER